jgi:TAT (twin-arginine translocation) pathway signal sequence
MTTSSTLHRISRRDFLKWAAVGGAAVAGGYALSEAAPWLDYGQQAEATWNPPSQGSASARATV